MAFTPGESRSLTTSRGAALYIGAILGPGLLLLPGLAAAEAGPASILAWLALLGLSGLFAAVFSALGRQVPSAGGVMGYVTAGLGRRAGRATGWMFLAGVVGGAPIVCLIGASYVTDLTGGGQVTRAAVAAVLLLIVLGLAAGGLRASATAQLVLVSLLTVVVVVAVTGSASAARAGNWMPFAPHGWLSVGSAAATLMFSFAGWEAVAPLTTRFADPARQLPRAVATALAVTTVLYLGLAVATISVLGPSAATDIPLAALLSHAIGTAGPDAAAVAAIVLTLGATNAYINGAAVLAGQLVQAAPGGRSSAPMVRLLAAIGLAGLLLITLYGLRIVGTVALVAVPTVLFLTVYLGAMAAAVRVLRGRVRLAALPAGLAVTVMLGFCGWALVLPLGIALAIFRPLAVGRRERSAGLEVDGVPGGRVGRDGLEVVAQGVGAEGDQADRRGAVHAAVGQFVPDDDRGRIGVGQAVAVGQREPVAPGILDRSGRVGVGTVRGELGTEVPGLDVRLRQVLRWVLLRGLRWVLLRGLLRGRRVGVAGVGDDVGLVRLEVLQGGA
ncbi:MAG TPA: amino acid permease, partial [Streptosporangiaceae bacterium]|nr:amino acid permease [Streptosporangiaceae bacterium]